MITCAFWVSRVTIVDGSEILHHLGCKIPVVNDRINYLLTGARFQPSTVGHGIYLPIHEWLIFIR